MRKKGFIMRPLEMYGAVLKREQLVYETRVWAYDIESATDVAYELGILNHLVFPDEWDEITVRYIGEEE